jgi:hypothetical protein
MNNCSVDHGNNRWRFLLTSTTDVIQNHENAKVRNIGQGEAQYRKHKKLKLGGGQTYDRSSIHLDRCCFGIICCTEPVLTEV